MKVTRTSGLPIDGVAEYKAELDKGMIALNEELGRFEKMTDQQKRSDFLKRFEEMKKEVMDRYTFEADWDFETVLRSKTKFKELCNQYGVIAFARGDDGALQCFIVDSKF